MEKKRNTDHDFPPLFLWAENKNLVAADYLNLISLWGPTGETETFNFCIDAIFGIVPVLKCKNEKTTFSDLHSLHLKLINYEATENFPVSGNTYQLGKTEEAGLSREELIWVSKYLSQQRSKTKVINEIVKSFSDKIGK